MSALPDTIAALSTPAGTAALAVVRATGPLCGPLFASIYGKEPVPRFARHADYRSITGAILDDVVLLYLASPSSYTGEDTLEISCHGNPLIAQRILEDLLSRGCRAAEPGEFTRRAFLNGRMDLSQAEAVIDIIHARSERALLAANQQLRGSLGRHLTGLTEDLLDVLARVEAYIDFPDEDLPPEDQQLVKEATARLESGLERLLATQHYGEILRDGVKTVILGEPNAGKSSLLNRLVGSERALVSPEPGTTRDFIEERLLLGPHCIRLIDTAGLNPSPAELERRGMDKTLERAAEADLFLLVLDSARPVPPLPAAAWERMTPSNTLVVANKVDLASVRFDAGALPSPDIVEVSALTGFGVPELQRRIIAHAERFRMDHGDEVIAINARHAEALRHAKDALARAAGKIGTTVPAELLASDLRDALSSIGEIAGRIDNERMLDRLFATFCIGK